MVGQSETRRRVLLAEDCPAVRRSVRNLLERDHMEIVGEAGDGAEAVRLTKVLHPDVVVLDRSMPHLNGFQAARAIAEGASHPAMVLLTIQLAAHHVVLGMQLGIRGFVAKSDAADELARAVEHVCTGGTFLSAAASRAMHEAHLNPNGGQF